MKWLVVRFSAIGDCAMAAHVPSRIRRAQPDAHISWAVEQRCQDVVDTEFLVQDRFSIPRDQWRKARWSLKTYRETLAYYASLRRVGFDVGLDLQGHLKTAICLKLSGAKKRLAIKGTDALARRLNPVLVQNGRSTHCVELALECLSQVLDSQESSEPIMPKLIAERDRIRHHFDTSRPLIAIAVNAGQWDKAYPLEKWAQVADELLKDGHQLAYIGGPESSAPSGVGGIDLVGKLTLAESMALIDESALLLTGDTGAGHLAATYHTPTVSVFGPTDPAVFRPWTDRGIVLREGKETSNVSCEQVIEAARKQLNTYGSKLFGQPVEFSR